MSALIPFKRTQPAPDTHAIRGIRPRRESKPKGRAATRAQRKKSTPLASQPSRKPRTHKNQPRKAARPTVEQLKAEIITLYQHLATAQQVNTELQKALAIVTAESVLLRKERNGANAILRLIA